MPVTKTTFTFILLFTALLAPPLPAENDAAPGVLLELFTSQSCYSCPPAEALLRERYADRDDVVALEYHVDYWNDLVYGLAGAWVDPFSDPDYTRRQRNYNLNLRRTGSVYTPQMIVQGQHQGGGAQRGRIDSFIEQEKARAPALRFHFDGAPDSGLTARLEGALNGSEELHYAVYWREKTTAIPAGENKGKELINRNIVKAVGSSRASRRYLNLPKINTAEEGCAVWVQRRQTGAVIAAAHCPS